MKRLTQEQIQILKDNFPQVIAEAKSDLKVYPRTGIYFENSKFYTTPHTYISNRKHAADYAFIGDVYQEDLLTEEEIKEANEALSKCEWF